MVSHGAILPTDRSTINFVPTPLELFESFSKQKKPGPDGPDHSPH